MIEYKIDDVVVALGLTIYNSDKQLIGLGIYLPGTVSVEKVTAPVHFCPARIGMFDKIKNLANNLEHELRKIDYKIAHGGIDYIDAFPTPLKFLHDDLVQVLNGEKRYVPEHINWDECVFLEKLGG